MTTYINKIVQITRKLHAVDPAVTLATPTEETVREYEALMVARFDLVLTAIKAGVDPDLIQWAIKAETPMVCGFELDDGTVAHYAV